MQKPCCTPCQPLVAPKGRASLEWHLNPPSPTLAWCVLLQVVSEAPRVNSPGSQGREGGGGKLLSSAFLRTSAQMLGGCVPGAHMTCTAQFDMNNLPLCSQKDFKKEKHTYGMSFLPHSTIFLYFGVRLLRKWSALGCSEFKQFGVGLRPDLKFYF